MKKAQRPQPKAVSVNSKLIRAAQKKEKEDLKEE
jgi:hypothetical protein